ncbi:MAG: RHS repeat-associated core domain-containing protein [Kangiellaceae bacterium]|jgi:hypothetical protein|nr:RHS repeat-associated core domain-containing protein [Kangiellaceae bacterium]
MQARYYDPVIGRFYANDPVDFKGHMELNNTVNGFGRYTYANNNPYKYVDPDGKIAISQQLVFKIATNPNTPRATAKLGARAAAAAATSQVDPVVPGPGDVVAGLMLAYAVVDFVDDVLLSESVDNKDPAEDYTGHGEDPEGQTGQGSNWDKHSRPRAGKKYGGKRNAKRGRKNKKYQRPKNPNKKTRDKKKGQS